MVRTLFPGTIQANTDELWSLAEAELCQDADVNRQYPKIDSIAYNKISEPECIISIEYGHNNG